MYIAETLNQEKAMRRSEVIRVVVCENGYRIESQLTDAVPRESVHVDIEGVRDRVVRLLIELKNKKCDE